MKLKQLQEARYHQQPGIEINASLSGDVVAQILNDVLESKEMFYHNEEPASELLNNREFHAYIGNIVERKINQYINNIMGDMLFDTLSDDKNFKQAVISTIGEPLPEDQW